MRFSKPKRLNTKLLALIGIPLCVIALVAVIFIDKNTKAPHNNASLNTVNEQPQALDTPPKTEEATTAPTDTATPQPAKATPTAPATTPAPTETKNPYDVGYAQWHVYNRRIAVAKTMSAKLIGNNGNYWLNTAKNEGYTVDKNYEQYAIAVRTNGAGSAMAFVESVNTDGTLTMSAMNYTSGFNRTDTFQVAAEEIPAWTFIH